MTSTSVSILHQQLHFSPKLQLLSALIVLTMIFCFSDDATVIDYLSKPIGLKDD